MVAGLRQFLTTNYLDAVRPGLHISKIVQCLGPPQDYRLNEEHGKPEIYKYASVEIHFDPVREVCTWIHIEACGDDNAFLFPEAYATIQWELPPFSTIDQVAAFLTTQQIAFSHKRLSKNKDSQWGITTIQESDMTLWFDDDGPLFAFASGRNGLSER